MDLKFPVYKPDLSPRLTLMLTPSLVGRVDGDVRHKCLKLGTEPFSEKAVVELMADTVQGLRAVRMASGGKSHRKYPCSAAVGNSSF